ncbi:hypothetical protein KCP70_23135 [Salmonella enterica subsp. enterica]|nr:hypothetical protein KCP70_23135 [Salmonella enterica subsp. enterica]
MAPLQQEMKLIRRQSLIVLMGLIRNLNKYDARIAAIDYTSRMMMAFYCAPIGAPQSFYLAFRCAVEKRPPASIWHAIRHSCG